jgi:streptomycin 6-kinase
MTLRISSELEANCRKTPERAVWLDRLPDLLRMLERQWSLTLNAPFDGEDVSCCYVVAATRSDGTSAVLKIRMPHMDGEHEIYGQRFWDGDPTVRLLIADDDLGAMLLERCEPGTVLRALPEYEQHVVIAGLLRRLWRLPPARHHFRPCQL